MSWWGMGCCCGPGCDASPEVSGHITGGLITVGQIATHRSFDFPSDTWSAKAALGLARREHGLAIEGGEIVALCGATAASGANADDECERYSVGGDSWSTETDATEVKRGLAFFSLGDDAFVVAGLNATVRTQTVFSLSGGTWTARDSINAAARFTVPGCTIRKAVSGTDPAAHYFGGSTNTLPTYQNDNEQYTVDAWVTKTDMTTARQGATALAPCAQSAHVLGGSHTDESTENEKYDAAGDSWSTMTDLPVAFNIGAGFVHGEYAVYVGGQNASGANLDTTTAYSPVTDGYTTKDALDYVVRSHAGSPISA